MRAARAACRSTRYRAVGPLTAGRRPPAHGREREQVRIAFVAVQEAQADRLADHGAGERHERDLVREQVAHAAGSPVAPDWYVLLAASFGLLASVFMRDGAPCVVARRQFQGEPLSAR